jgi:hypothetical protein
MTFAPAAALATLIAAALPALAQTPKVTYVIADYSTPALIDKAAAEAIWHQHLPEARMVKVYPTKRYGFLSQVTGGLADGGTCVVSARAVMLPRTSPTRRLVWEPAKSSTVIGAQNGATAAQCSELAGKKLTEAVQSLATSLVK